MKYQLFSVLLIGMSLMSCGDDSVESSSIRFSAYNLSFVESEGTISVGLMLDQRTTAETQVNFIFTGGTATPGEDFSDANTRLTIPEGTSSAEFEIEIIDDDDSEGWEESFTVSIESVEGAIKTGNDLVLTIIDNEMPITGYEAPDSYSGYELSWSDEFDELNEDHWTFELGTGCPDLCGWGNDELQSYTDENHDIVDGHLLIEARKNNSGAYYSTRMISEDKVLFQYGRIDIRASMPYGQGVWPALWLLGNNIDEVGWPACGEIDIMEMVGGNGENDATTHGTVHWEGGGGYANYGGKYTIPSFNKLAEEFHLYSIVWDEEKIVWLFDNEEFHVIDITPSDLTEFHDEFFMILNIAVGGRWPGNPDESTIFPQRMFVDYIRYYTPTE